MRLGEHIIAIAASQETLDLAGDKSVFRFPIPVRVVRWGAVISVALDATPGALTLKLDHTTHSNAGVPTRSDGSGGTNCVISADKVVGSVVFAEPTSDLIVRPGDFLTMEVTGAATAGDGFTFVEVQPLPVDELGLTGQFSDDSTVRFVDGSTAI